MSKIRKNIGFDAFLVFEQDQIYIFSVCVCECVCVCVWERESDLCALILMRLRKSIKVYFSIKTLLQLLGKHSKQAHKRKCT